MAHEEKVAIFCSFLMHAFDPRIYDGPLQDMCRTHDYLIPSRDYRRHKTWVNRAFSDVFGPPNIHVLESMVACSRWAVPQMPYWQALLLSLKDDIPDQAAPLLESCLRHEELAAVQKSS